MIRHHTLAASIAAALLAGCGGGDSASPNATPANSLAALTTHVQSGTSAAEAPAPVAFPGKLADYTVVRSATGVVVTEKAGAKASVAAPANSTLVFADVTVATDLDGVAPQVYRLYQAAFDRTPDLPGLGYHIAGMQGQGLPLQHIAIGFVESPEFSQRYGQLNDEQFITRLYNNVLKRAPEAEGLKYYLDLLAARTVTRAMVLTFFSESPENKNLVAPSIANGVAFVPHVVGGAGSASANKVAWQWDTPLGVVLRDRQGTPVAGALSCQSLDTAVVTVAADCSTARGLRLGEHSIQVSGGGASATLKVKVIPQRQLMANFAPSSADGTNNSLVVTPEGNVIGWGGDNHYVLNQGKGTSAEFPLPVLVPGPGRQGLLANIASVFGGEQRAMGVTEDGNAVMWGDHPDWGKIDQLTWMDYITNPTNNGRLSGIVQVAGGWSNTAALADDGRVYSWGYYHGQGDDKQKNVPNLVKDPSGNGPLTGIVAIRSGWNHTLALGANGKVYAWGWNTSGQTGRGFKSDPAELPAVVLKADGTELTNVVSIAAGRDSSYALLADGSVWAWGDNGFNDLGQGKSYGEYFRAVPVKNPEGTGPLTGIVMISAGENHALALQESGHVLSWGFDADGALGTGPNGDRKNPGLPARVVSENALEHLSGVVAIGSAISHNYAVKADGTLLMWGDGYSSALAQGTVTNADSSFPIPVKNAAGTGPLKLPLSAYHNLRQRYR